MKSAVMLVVVAAGLAMAVLGYADGTAALIFAAVVYGMHTARSIMDGQREPVPRLLAAEPIANAEPPSADTSGPGPEDAQDDVPTGMSPGVSVAVAEHGFANDGMDMFTQEDDADLAPTMNRYGGIFSTSTLESPRPFARELSSLDEHRVDDVPADHRRAGIAR